MQFNISDILFLMVLFLLLFISVFLFTSNRGKHISNILIGCFFLSLCLNLIDGFLLLKQFYFQYPAFALWGSVLLLLCGPFIFLYTQSVIYKDFHFTSKKISHFIPFIILFLLSEGSYLAAGHDKQIAILKSIIERKIPLSVNLGSLIIYIHFFYYLIVSLRLEKRYETVAANLYSDAQKVTLNWLRTSILFFLLLMLVSAVNTYLSFQSSQEAYFIVLSCAVFLLLLFIVLVLFMALRNPGLFSVWEEKQVTETVEINKSVDTTAISEEKQNLYSRLQSYMQQNKPYLDPELTLDALAVQLQVKPKLLSQSINEVAKQNFFEFINHYRIEEAKRLLTNPKDKKITVLEVMYEVGFNSKSSFNTLFKKHTGITPSEFKRNSMHQSVRL
jgi:AraC-like DNA-binding protein